MYLMSQALFTLTFSTLSQDYSCDRCEVCIDQAIKFWTSLTRTIPRDVLIGKNKNLSVGLNINVIAVVELSFVVVSTDTN